jgi:hypothetical protein
MPWTSETFTSKPLSIAHPATTFAARIIPCPPTPVNNIDKISPFFKDFNHFSE